LGGGDGYHFGKDFVLKASLYLTQDLPIQYKVKNFTRANLRKIEANWENIKTYLATTVRLVAKFGYRWENIVAPLTLVPIAFWLMRRNNDSFDKSSKSEDVMAQTAIKKWLTVSLLKNVLGGSSDTTLKTLRDELIKTDGSATFPGLALNAAVGIDGSLSDQEIDELLLRKYRGKYTYLILSLLYQDREWKDTTFHEDHIFPISEFGVRALRRRGYDEERIGRYQGFANTVLNLELLTDSENLSKNATSFDKWIATRDAGFKTRHLIPVLKSYDFDGFENFIDSRKAMLVRRLKAI
jgi:hypothetical protein